MKIAVKPRDRKQLYKRLYQLNQTPSSPVNKENNDELLQMIEEQRKNGSSESIVVNNKAYFFFMCSSNQIQDIIKFCCPEGDASVLGIDTFNLCDLFGNKFMLQKHLNRKLHHWK